MRRKARAFGLALLTGLGLVLAPVATAAASEQLWALLKAGGQVVLIRHAITTPGVGDPSGMRLDDCSTQRNLTEAGRGDADSSNDRGRGSSPFSKPGKPGAFT